MEKVFLFHLHSNGVYCAASLWRHQLLFIADPDEEETAVTQRRNILKLSVKKFPPPPRPSNGESSDTSDLRWSKISLSCNEKLTKAANGGGCGGGGGGALLPSRHNNLMQIVTS